MVAIGERTKLRAVREVDAAGLTIAPGFIDMHTHGILDVDFMESDREATLRGLRAYAAHGVTRVVASTLANPFDRSSPTGERLGNLLVGPIRTIRISLQQDLSASHFFAGPLQLLHHHLKDAPFLVRQTNHVLLVHRPPPCGPHRIVDFPIGSNPNTVP